MPQHDPDVRHPDEPGRVDVGLFANREHRASHQAGVARDRGHADRNHDVGDAGPQGGDDHEGEEDAGEGQHGIDNAHEDGVHRAPVVAGNEAQRGSQHGPDGDADEAEDERHAGTVDHTAEDVPAETVGAEPEVGRGSLAGAGDGGQRIVGCAEGCEDREQHPTGQDGSPDDESGGERPAPDADAPDRHARGRHAGAPSRMRGSSQAASRSTSRLTRTYIVAMNSTIPCTSG